MAPKEDVTTNEAVSTGRVTKRFHIRISRADYEVLYCKHVEYQGHHVAGLCDIEAKKIYIDTSTEDPTETLLHEILHAEVYEGGIRQYPSWSQDLEEVLVEVFSRSIASLFTLRRKR